MGHEINNLIEADESSFVIASTSSDNRGLFFSFIGSGYFLQHSG